MSRVAYGVIESRLRCPKCRSYLLVVIGRRKYRCCLCGYEFST
ncbi:MAG: hypothetical protein QXH99_07910 [Sulfolobales archaeon]